MFNVRLFPKAEKELSKLIKKDKERIIKSLLDLKDNPFSGKKLKGDLAGHYSIRVWPYRIIYFVKKEEVLIIVIRIGQRKDVYK